MKKNTLTIICLLAALSSQAQPLDRSIRPKAGPAPEIKLGKIDRFELPNGLKVFVVENHKLPTVACNIQFDIKPELEGNMAGYQDMMSELMTSGTKTRSNERLNEEIDFIGAEINYNSDSRTLSGSGLKKHEARLFELLGDIAANTDIKKEELEKVRTRTLSGLEAEKNQPDAMLKNVSAVVDFGKDHPYGEVATAATVQNITLEKCRDFYSTYMRPNVAYMAIVGDVTIAEVKPLVEKYFGGWQKANVPSTTYSNPTAPANAKVAFVPREGAVQSVINVTYPVDLMPGTPDVIKTRVANAILGGGSNGRLFLNLREKHGWTYGSYSSLVPDDLKGHFTAYAKCRNVVSDSSVGEILNEMKRLQNETVSEQELHSNITYLSGNFAIGLENPQTVAQYAINIERYHMPADYYQNYLKNLSAVTASDVQDAAHRYIHPDQANIVVVGSKDDVAKTLAKYASDGNVNYYDNYGQPLMPTTAATVPAGITADAVLKHYVTAIGGEKAIMSIKDIKTISKGSIDAGGRQIDLTITEMKKAPGSLMVKVEAMGMVVNHQVFNGTSGYVEQQGNKKTMEADDIQEAKEQADIYADLHADQLGIKRTLRGIENVNGSDAYVVDAVNTAGKKTVEYYDVKTGFLVKKITTSEQGSQSVEYADYKEVPGSNGYKMPYTIKLAMGPQVVTGKVESVEINKGIPDSEFN